jgi:hypothetical protein
MKMSSIIDIFIFWIIALINSSAELMCNLIELMPLIKSINARINSVDASIESIIGQIN